MHNEENNICEFCDCTETATHFDESLQAWLCDEHEGAGVSAGYCTTDCMLGYGCDGSC
jgi:hypothetical protein